MPAAEGGYGYMLGPSVFNGSIINSFKSGAIFSWYTLPATALTALRQVAKKSFETS